MKVLLRAEQARSIDRSSSQDFGIQAAVLMENAGRSCYELFRDSYFDKADSVIVLAGSGNNGGDGYVFARHFYLQLGAHVNIICVSEPKTALCKEQHEICQMLGIPIINWKENASSCLALLCSASWIIDAICGIGLEQEIRQRELIEHVQDSPARIFAIDVPSGIRENFQPKDSAIRADCTASIGFAKSMLYQTLARRYCGKIHCVYAGFPPAVLDHITIDSYLVEDADIRIPGQEADSYKNTNGVLAVCAGSEQSAGAAILATRAATQMSSGKIHLFVDLALQHLVLAVPTALVQELSVEDIQKIRCNAFLLGCGWGTEKREDVLASVLQRSEALVLDADALNIIAERKDLQELLYISQQEKILTPHPGEAAALLGVRRDMILQDAYSSAQNIARKYSAHVVLKSHVTIVASPAHKDLIVVDGMNAALAHAGSGDVLAGIIASLSARGLSACDAACYGAQIHQLAGREILRQKRIGIEAVVDVLPAVMQSLPGL